MSPPGYHAVFGYEKFFPDICHLFPEKSIILYDRSLGSGGAVSRFYHSERSRSEHMKQAVLDKDAFCAQVVGCQETMFRTARAILRNDQDAEDAVQEAICAAFARRDSLRDAGKFKPWMLRILANKCYDACRKRRNTSDLDAAGEVPAPEADQAERLSLWQAVLSLNDDLRAPVALFYYDGLSIREISGVLGISEASVKTRLSRGRARLRQMLDEK